MSSASLRTIETPISSAILISSMETALRMSGHLHDNEVLVDIQFDSTGLSSFKTGTETLIEFKDIVPIAFTIKKEV